MGPCCKCMALDIMVRLRLALLLPAEAQERPETRLPVQCSGYGRCWPCMPSKYAVAGLTGLPYAHA